MAIINKVNTQLNNLREKRMKPKNRKSNHGKSPYWWNREQNEAQKVKCWLFKKIWAKHKPLSKGEKKKIYIHNILNKTEKILEIKQILNI